MQISYSFVNYGTVLNPEKGTLVLDVGMKTIPGVIDHHHPEAEAECTASLVAKYPHLVLDHVEIEDIESSKIRIITHRLPDFDSVSSIFLVLKLLELKRVDTSMEKIAAYTLMVDSATLPKEVDLSSTPYSILRALFSTIRNGEDETNLERAREGLKFMNFLYTKAEERYEIHDNRLLFSGIERYEKAMRKAEGDYFNYLSDLKRSQKISLYLPLISGNGKKRIDTLIVRNPRCFLLKEWARRDMENTSLNEGFGLTVTNFGYKRYILGVDPEKRVNLKGLGDLLEEKESQKRKEIGSPHTYHWYDGNCPFFNYRITDSPQDGTVLSHQEVIDTLLYFSQHLE